MLTNNQAIIEQARKVIAAPGNISVLRDAVKSGVQTSGIWDNRKSLFVGRVSPEILIPSQKIVKERGDDGVTTDKQVLDFEMTAFNFRLIFDFKGVYYQLVPERLYSYNRAQKVWRDLKFTLTDPLISHLLHAVDFKQGPAANIRQFLARMLGKSVGSVPVKHQITDERSESYRVAKKVYATVSTMEGQVEAPLAKVIRQDGWLKLEQMKSIHKGVNQNLRPGHGYFFLVVSKNPIFVIGYMLQKL